MKRIAIASLSVLLSAHLGAKADIYHCKKGGRVVYADTQCGERYRRLHIPRFEAPLVKAIASNESDSRYTVPGAINGTSTNFIVDTGASITSIPDSKREAFGLLEQCRATNFDTENGQVSGCIYKAKTVRVGGIELKDILIASMPNLKASLLGMNAVSKLKIGGITDTEILFIQK